MAEIRAPASESRPLTRIYSKLRLAAFPRPAGLLLGLMLLAPPVLLEALAGTLVTFFYLRVRLGVLVWWLAAVLVLALFPPAAVRRTLRPGLNSRGAAAE